MNRRWDDGCFEVGCLRGIEIEIGRDHSLFMVAVEGWLSVVARWGSNGDGPPICDCLARCRGCVQVGNPLHSRNPRCVLAATLREGSRFKIKTSQARDILVRLGLSGIDFPIELLLSRHLLPRNARNEGKRDGRKLALPEFSREIGAAILGILGRSIPDEALQLLRDRIPINKTISRADVPGNP